MSKKKRKQKGPVATRPLGGVTVESPAALWPQEFIPLRKAVLTAFCVGGWGLILAVLALGNDLLGLKQAGLIIAGARLEPMLLMESLHSADIAAVLFWFVLVLGAGYIHVSLGLAVLLAVSPWRDGYVYNVDNYYFLWAAMLLVGIWALRQWSDPKPILGKLPLGLLVAFWCISALAGLNAMQFDSTYHELLLWVYYGVVLFLATNATHGGGARAAVLCGLLIGVAGQAIYAYPYLYYVMPFLRENMGAGSALLADHFGGIAEATPEIAQRINRNRAAASMVHANALAALLILGIPVCLALAVDGWRRLRARRTSETAPVTQFRFVLPWALTVFLGIAAIVFFVGILRLSYRSSGGGAWFGGTGGLSVLTVAVAGTAMGAFLFAARARGLARALVYLQTISTTLLVPTMLGALWLTYSRGAMLALGVAFVAVATLVYMPPGTIGRLTRRFRKANLVVLGCLLLPTLALLCQTLPPVAIAQEEAIDSATTPSNVMTEEGLDVEVSDLANPATLLLRLTYWRVALSMAADNWLTGVGMGNFKFAYPQYQYLGAGDVQNAHNGFLQAWCETGIFGVLALIAFWVVVLWTSARGLRGTGAPMAHGLLLGLTAGILAFLLHALLDMNLSHPTLMAFAMAATGLALHYREPGSSEDGSGAGKGRLLPALALGLAVIVSGIAMRPYLQHLGLSGGKYLHVGDTDMVQRRYRAADFFLTKGPAWAQAGKKSATPEMDIRYVVTLLSDRAQLFTLGRIVAFDPRTGQDVVLPEDAGIPAHARFQLVRPWDAQSIVFEAVLAWLEEVERIDARVPYSPEHALTLCSGYKLLAESAGKHHAALRPSMAEAALRWGKEAARRSPRRADVYQMLGWAHWTQGTYAQGPANLEHFQAALAAFERSTELAPNEARYYLTLSETTGALGRSYANAGQPGLSEDYLNRAQAAKAEAERIWRLRGALGLP